MPPAEIATGQIGFSSTALVAPQRQEYPATLNSGLRWGSVAERGAGHEQLGQKAGFGKRKTVGEDSGGRKIVVGQIRGRFGIGPDERIAQETVVQDQLSRLKRELVGQERVDRDGGGEHLVQLPGGTIEQGNGSCGLHMGESLRDRAVYAKGLMVPP